MEMWSWICELPESEEWSTTESDTPLFFPLATSSSYKQPSQLFKVSSSSHDDTTQPIQLRANRSLGTDSGGEVTFSVCCGEKVMWVSDTCPLNSKHPFLPLILQLIQEIISLAPTAHDSSCPRSQLQKLKPEPVLWILDSHSPESISRFFDVVFLTRLFWLCVCDAPSDVGSMYFHTLLAPNLEGFSCTHAPVMHTFFVSVGVDVELCFTRTFGYMIAKLLILKELGVGLQLVTRLPYHNLGFSYALESHGLWIMKGYAPVSAMRLTCSKSQINSQYFPMHPLESVLKYALAHQQLEAVMQLEYSVKFNDGFIQVGARVDNLRFHMAKLGFNKNEDDDYSNETYFPSRIRVWIGPEMGASYVTSMTLGRSTDNFINEVEMHKVLKGNFGKTKEPKLKTTSRTVMRSKLKNWRWDQNADGNVANFEATLCDNSTGVEVATWKPSNGGGDKLEYNFRDRYTGANRGFGKNGDIVFSRSECGETVEWRLNKEMEGSVLKWRMGGQIWLSYWPNQVMNTSYFETRCVEWCYEVDLPLIVN